VLSSVVWFAFEWWCVFFAMQVNVMVLGLESVLM
jgi:hypothetical protein